MRSLMPKKLMSLFVALTILSTSMHEFLEEVIILELSMLKVHSEVAQL